MTLSVAIIGAGLGGLTAALALMRDGHQVRVFEQAPVLGEVGAGITVSPGAGQGLGSLGIEAELLAASTPIPDIAFAHYRTGALLAGRFETDAPLDRGFSTPRHIHRADLHAILLAAVRAMESGAVVSAKRLVQAASDKAGVTMAFADGDTARADIVIGADGSRSSVRRLLFEDSPPQFAGQIAFRCLIPRDAAAPCLSAGNAAVFVGPGRVFNRYLIRHGALVNVIGLAQCDLWRNEGWNTPATPEEFTQVFEGFHEDVLGLVERAPPESLIKWGLFVREPLSGWSAGRVVLIGDAAHPILPFLGLGAALAIEDGLVLARALATGASPPAAFAAFERARTARVETVRQESIRQGRILQSGEPDGAAVARSPSQNAALFDYDPRTAALHV
jgi:salicylate hydroxylase